MYSIIRKQQHIHHLSKCKFILHETPHDRDKNPHKLIMKLVIKQAKVDRKSPSDPSPSLKGIWTLNSVLSLKKCEINVISILKREKT